MYTLRTVSLLLGVAAGVKAVSAVPSLEARAAPSPDLDSCPGYTARNVIKTSSTLTADLKLAGKPCNVYGADITELRLEVTYDDGMFPVLILQVHPERWKAAYINPRFPYPC